MANRNIPVRGRKRIVFAAGRESMGSKGKRGILFSGLVVIVAFFMVWAGAAIGSMISPPNQIVLQNQSIAQYVYGNNSSAIPFANVNGQIEYPMPAGQHVSYIETNATLAELNSRDAGKIALNLSQPGASSPATNPDVEVTTPRINITESGLPAGTRWGVKPLGYPDDLAVYSTTSDYLNITAMSYPLPFEVFPQSAHPSSFIIDVAGGVPATYVHITFGSPEPSYYLYSLQAGGTVTVSVLKDTSYLAGNTSASGVRLTNVSTIRVGTDPVTMQTVGPYTYVLNEGSSNISVIYGTKLFGSISLPSGSEPDAMDIFNGTIYVTGKGTDSLYLIGQKNMTLYETIHFSEGTNPVGVSVSNVVHTYTTSGRNETVAFVAIDNGTGNGTMAVVVYDGISYSTSYFSLYAKSPTSMAAFPYSGDIRGLNGVVFQVLVSVQEAVEMFSWDAAVAGGEVTYANQSAGPGVNFLSDLRLSSGTLMTPNGTGVLASNATESIMYLLSPGATTGYGGFFSVGHREYTDAVSLPDGLDIFSWHGGLNVSSQMDQSYMHVPWDPVAISYSSIENYSITFSESGMPSGTNWTMSLDNVTQTVNTTSMTFYASNGTYSYTAKFVNYSGRNGIVGYIPSRNGTGTVSINGSSVSRTVVFAAEYAVSFTESGLPSDTSWAISLNGVAENTTSTTISFSEPNGTYSYTVGGVTGYTTTQASGTVTVNGSSVRTAISFSPLVVIPTEITIGYGTDPQNFVPFAYAVVNGSSATFTIQPQYLTGNQSKYLMIRISSSATSIDLRATIYGNSGISTYFGPITGEEIGYWLGAVMIFGGAFMAMPWHDFRLKRGVKR